MGSFIKHFKIIVYQNRRYGKIQNILSSVYRAICFLHTRSYFVDSFCIINYVLMYPLLGSSIHYTLLQSCRLASLIIFLMHNVSSYAKITQQSIGHPTPDHIVSVRHLILDHTVSMRHPIPDHTISKRYHINISQHE